MVGYSYNIWATIELAEIAYQTSHCGSSLWSHLGEIVRLPVFSWSVHSTMWHYESWTIGKKFQVSTKLICLCSTCSMTHECCVFSNRVFYHVLDDNKETCQ